MMTKITTFITSAMIGAVALSNYVPAKSSSDRPHNKHVNVTASYCERGAEPECQHVLLRVWDGDTFTMHPHERKPIKIRIENIDAPEIDGKCQWEIDAAQKAKNRLAALIAGHDLRFILGDKDRYDRQLAVVIVDGQDVGAELISEKLVRPWTGRRQPWC